MNKSKFNLFLDFDNTIVNSVEQSVNILNKKYSANQNYKYLKKYNYKDLFPKITGKDVDDLFASDEFFDGIHTFNGVCDTLEEIKDHYQIQVVTLGTQQNIKKKTKWIADNLDELIFDVYGHDFNGNNKSFINMQGGICVDDNIDCLRTCNAKIKILFKNYIDTEWNRTEPSDNVYIVNSWKEIKDILNFYIKIGEII